MEASNPSEEHVARRVAALERARACRAAGLDVDAALRELRTLGPYPIDGIVAVRDVYGLSLAEAKTRLHSCTAWYAEARASDDVAAAAAEAFGDRIVDAGADPGVMQSRVGRPEIDELSRLAARRLPRGFAWLLLALALAALVLWSLVPSETKVDESPVLTVVERAWQELTPADESTLERSMRLWVLVASNVDLRAWASDAPLRVMADETSVASWRVFPLDDGGAFPEGCPLTADDVAAVRASGAHPFVVVTHWMDAPTREEFASTSSTRLYLEYVYVAPWRERPRTGTFAIRSRS